MKYETFKAFVLLLMFSMLSTVGLLPLQAQQAMGQGSWSGEFGPGNGIDGEVWAMEVTDTGVVYVGGNFTEAGGEPANYIARWTGSTWEPLGEGVNDVVYALALDGEGNVYAGGWFTEAGGEPANYIARWDGQNWEPLGEGVRHSFYDVLVKAIVVDSSGLVYVGGDFTEAGGEPANNIARWDGQNWEPLGMGLTGDAALDEYVDDVYALALDAERRLYVGGEFTEAGGEPANHIARWNGQRWEPLGEGTNDNVFTLDFDVDGMLYVGGDFTKAGGAPANYIARWNGQGWEPLGEGVNDDVSPLATTVWALATTNVTGSAEVYAAGDYSEAGGAPANDIARWDGQRWEPLGSGLRGSPKAIAVEETRVYVGGLLRTAGGQPTEGIALWERAQPMSTGDRRIGETPPQWEAVYPNPFRDELTISFHTAVPSHVRLSVYNTLSQQVALLTDAVLPPGSHQMAWTPPRYLPGGLYAIRLQVGTFIHTRTVVLTP